MQEEESNFAIIKTHEQLTNAALSHDDFKISTIGNQFIIAKYVLTTPETFVETDQNYKFLRECRGIVFNYRTNEILSRPYHKFFNLGEKPSSRLENLPYGSEFSLLEKLDGSMIHLLWDDDACRLIFATKSIYSDVQKTVGEWAVANGLYQKFEDIYEYKIQNKITPIFEWCGVNNTIVVRHPIDKLILTGIRYNETGEYFSYSEMKEFADLFDLECVEQISSGILTREIISSLVENASSGQGMEGHVVRFQNGDMIKLKLAWYVLLHKNRDSLVHEKDVIRLILGGFADDARSIMNSVELANFDAYEKAFWRGIKNTAESIYKIGRESKDKKLSRKDFALQFSMLDPFYKSIIFSTWDNFSRQIVTENVLALILKRTTSGPLVEANRYLWGNAVYKECILDSPE